MTRRLVVLWLVVAAMLGVALLTNAACESYPDDKECRGDKVNALIAFGDAEAANACTNCMQRECCDRVGACADQPPDKCPDEFKRTQSCVLEGGPAAEPACKANLDSGLSRDLYTCMRPRCGKQCGVPSCTLSSAVTLFQSANCDRCVGNACCKPVNDCYENRQCKLFLECITEHCPNTLGPTLAASGTTSKEDLEAQRVSVCAGNPPPPQLDRARCLQRCLVEFTGAGTADDQAAQCLAFGVYTCAAGAGCGLPCTQEGGVITEGAYPQDLPDSAAQ